MSANIYSIGVKNISGNDTTLADRQGKVLLIVNTASECGYTPQYKGLQGLQEKYQANGLEVLGFPCNDFGAQEPGAEAQIQTFCETRFGVKFPLYGKVAVLGANKHPLYQHLIDQAATHEDVKWNFEKFLVSRDGTVIGRFKSNVTPESPELAKAIEAAL